MSVSFVVFVVALHFLFPIRPLRDIYHSPPPIDKTLLQTFVRQILVQRSHKFARLLLLQLMSLLVVHCQKKESACCKARWRTSPSCSCLGKFWLELGNERQSFLVFLFGNEDDILSYKMALDWEK